MRIAIPPHHLTGALALLLLLITAGDCWCCSTFMLKKGNVLVYGHNLNQGDLGIPGLVFLNKRGVFKTGRTWSELIDEDRSSPSSFDWISRYGSLTINWCGRDFPDGGMNEAGLFIGEMSEKAEYPRDASLPKLMHMHWIQHVLDMHATVDEVLESAAGTEIDGFHWHYFVGDASGDCAALAFIDGQVVVHRGESMPVPGLFNTPYERELELLRYFRGFGGDYEPVLDDPHVPRFVKTAVMVRDYDPAHNFFLLNFKLQTEFTVVRIRENA